MSRKLKNMKNEKCTLEYVEKNEKGGKWETHTVGGEIWWENRTKIKIETNNITITYI